MEKKAVLRKIDTTQLTTRRLKRKLNILYKEISQQLPANQHIVDVRVGSHADDFVHNQVTAIFYYDEQITNKAILQ